MLPCIAARIVVVVSCDDVTIVVPCFVSIDVVCHSSCVVAVCRSMSLSLRIAVYVVVAHCCVRVRVCVLMLREAARVVLLCVAACVLSPCVPARVVTVVYCVARSCRSVLLCVCPIRRVAA